jgi:DNA-binding MarR family transcriptional regulator
MPKPSAAAPRTPTGTALSELILLIFRLNNLLLDIGPLVTRDPDIIAVRWRILSAVAEEPRTAAQLGRELGLSRQGALLNVRILEELGLVELVDNPEDQRARKVALTAAGTAKLAEVNGHQGRWINELARNFGRDDIDTALDVLARLQIVAESSLHPPASPG